MNGEWTVEQWFNAGEAALWLLVAGACAIAARQQRGTRRLLALAATFAFALFGGSDLVEIRTGAWWSPWWLLAWKAACVLAIAGGTVWWRTRARR